MAPKVSIIMAAYNAEPFIAEAIESLLSQTFADFELLILDDGSTDGTVNGITSFDDARIRLFKEKHTGLTRSLNRLIKEAGGELIARADADDIYLPQRLERQVAAFTENPNLGVCGCFFKYMDGSGELSGGMSPPATNGEIKRCLRLVTSLSHPSVMMRAEALAQASGYDESFPIAQDYDLWTRLAPRWEFLNLPETLVHYRVHDQALSNQKLAEQQAAHRAIRAAFWNTLPPESFDPKKWTLEFDEGFQQEQLALEQIHVTRKEASYQMMRRRIYEANLAFGAKRPDIGMRCLWELSKYSGSHYWKPVLAMAKIIGFTATWRLARMAAGSQFQKAITDNPLLEWE